MRRTGPAADEKSTSRTVGDRPAAFVHVSIPQDVQRQDLTRISNIDSANVRGFAPCAVTAPAARTVSRLSLFNGLGKLQFAPRSHSFSIVAPCGRKPQGRGAIRLIRVIAASVPLFRLLGQPSRAGVDHDGGGNGCLGHVAGGRPRRSATTRVRKAKSSWSPGPTAETSRSPARGSRAPRGSGLVLPPWLATSDRRSTATRLRDRLG